MAYDEALAERIRLVLADAPELVERKMFGGICFMVGGHMTCGVLGDELIARVGPDAADGALARPGVREFDFTGRPMRTIVMVAPEALAGDAELEGWIAEARSFTGGLPPKRRR